MNRSAILDRPWMGLPIQHYFDAKSAANGATWLILKHEPYFDPHSSLVICDRDLREDRNSTNRLVRPLSFRRRGPEHIVCNHPRAI